MGRALSDISPDEREHIAMWMHDRLRRDKFDPEHESKRLAALASNHFGLGEDIVDPVPSWVISMADDIVGHLKPKTRALVFTEVFGLSKDDLLDIAFWIGRDDGYPATWIQVSQFVQSVVQGNLAELRRERVPPPPSKLRIKRRKS